MTETRFDVIAKMYEAAHQRCPNCRHDHEWLLNKYDVQHQNVLEISGGTGFLTEKLVSKKSPVNLIVHDISAEMLAFHKEKLSTRENIHYTVDPDMNLPTIPNGFFDAAFSLGGFHHIEDQICLFKAVKNKLKKGGIFCVGDFADNSPVQRYFDERINQLTSTGHQGLFASRSRLENLARFSGFDAVEVQQLRVPFEFQNGEDIGDFFQLVHGLNQNPKDTLKDIKNYFEIITYDKKSLVLMDYVYCLLRNPSA